MIEVAVVFSTKGEPIFWFKGISAGAVPDSRDLWNQIWCNREEVGGVAHTHPWNGYTTPSTTDLTTWAAIEDGLGVRLIWPIVTMTHVCYFAHVHPCPKVTPQNEREMYKEVYTVDFRDVNHWFDVIKTLRLLSQNGG